jgi:hypothetical protein
MRIVIEITPRARRRLHEAAVAALEYGRRRMPVGARLNCPGYG